VYPERPIYHPSYSFTTRQSTGQIENNIFSKEGGGNDWNLTYETEVFTEGFHKLKFKVHEICSDRSGLGFGIVNGETDDCG